MMDWRLIGSLTAAGTSFCVAGFAVYAVMSADSGQAKRVAASPTLISASRQPSAPALIPPSGLASSTAAPSLTMRPQTATSDYPPRLGPEPNYPAPQGSDSKPRPGAAGPKDLDPASKRVADLPPQRRPIDSEISPRPELHAAVPHVDYPG